MHGPNAVRPVVAGAPLPRLSLYAAGAFSDDPTSRYQLHSAHLPAIGGARMITASAVMPDAAPERLARLQSLPGPARATRCGEAYL